MRVSFLFGLVAALLVSGACLSQRQKTPKYFNEKGRLVWADEFNQNGLPDPSKWGFEVGGHGWGNNELQYYTASDTSNALVKNGYLHITARKDQQGKITSARLVTRGKKHFQYGFIEVRATLSPGRGTWPAIWMLGQNIETAGWPQCGEIDIMEHVGYQPDKLVGSIHTKAYNHVQNTQYSKSIFISHPYTQFHRYGLAWSAEKIIGYLDGKPYFEFANEHKSDAEWPFSQPFFLILNLAIGGNWGGQMGVDQQIFPTTMVVDYVRVYQ